MSNENKAPVQKTASERLTDLETAIAHLFNTNDNIVKDLSTLKNITTLLNNKMSAVVKTIVDKEEPTDEVLSRIMIDNNVADLTNKVTNLVLNGIIVQEDAISENSFVVGSDLNEDGSVHSPRVQFALKALRPDLQPSLLGKKPGDVLKLKDGNLSFKILETYKIQEQTAPEASDVTPETPVADPNAAAPVEATPSA